MKTSLNLSMKINNCIIFLRMIIICLQVLVVINQMLMVLLQEVLPQLLLHHQQIVVISSSNNIKINRQITNKLIQMIRKWSHHPSSHPTSSQIPRLLTRHLSHLLFKLPNQINNMYRLKEKTMMIQTV